MNAIAAITAWLPHRAGSLVLRANRDRNNGSVAARSRATPPDYAAEAAQVRALGLRRLKTDPSFAADLLEAADRHETRRTIEETS